MPSLHHRSMVRVEHLNRLSRSAMNHSSCRANLHNTIISSLVRPHFPSLILRPVRSMRFPITICSFVAFIIKFSFEK